ncbi:hypothetical protein FRB90_011281 [Tulasnella sp. 427]|nr:hypothetical protein FRB90_011281 [Tulasnella sp. 427]
MRRSSRSRSPRPKGSSYPRRDEDRERDRRRDDDRDRRRRDSPPPRGSRDDRYPEKPRPRDDYYSLRRDDRRDRDRRDDRAYGEGRRDRGDDRYRRRSRSPRRDSRTGSADASPKPKDKPNFGNSGLLAAATNTVKASDGTATVLKYNEPPEARKPTQSWRLWQIFLLIIHLARNNMPLYNTGKCRRKTGGVQPKLL